MYDIIKNIIDHSWATSDSSQQYIYMICGAMIIVLTAVFLDMVVRIFFRFSGTR